MGPESGGREKRLPTLSWESIVDDAPAPNAEPAAIEPMSIESLSTDGPAMRPETAQPSAPPPPPAPPGTPGSAVPASVDLSSATSQVAEEVEPEEPQMDGQIVPALRTAPPTTIVPALGVIDPGPADVSGGGEPAAGTSDGLPEIQEATPSNIHNLVAAAEDVEDSTGESPIVYRLPRAAQPDQTQVRPIPVQSPLAVSFTQPSRPDLNRSSGRGALLLLTLLILGGLIAAGIVFGRPYLFPEEWDETTEPYATTAEDVTGVAFAEQLVIVPEPTSAYTARLTNDLVGDWTADQARWRALGLLNGSVNEEVVSDLLSGWRNALYSAEDGQVYHDAGVAGDALDAELTLAMAGASLDQQFGWSVGQANRSLDDAALTLAEVLRQSRIIQQDSDFPEEIDVRDPTPLVFLPPILGYEVLAPLTFAEFAGPATLADAPNTLALLGDGGPGPIHSSELIDAAAPIVVAGDHVVGSPAAQDSGFWYLVFAGYVENSTAKAASDAIVENSLVMADRAGAACVYATFSGGDVGQTEVLKTTIEAWSAKVPSEFGSSTTVLADGTLQLVSCDPGEGFDNQSRLGTARELVGWRIAELATIEAVDGASGSDTDLAVALEQIDVADVGAELAILPLETSPGAAADAAREAVAGALAAPAE